MPILCFRVEWLCGMAERVAGAAHSEAKRQTRFVGRRHVLPVSYPLLLCLLISAVNATNKCSLTNLQRLKHASCAAITNSSRRNLHNTHKLNLLR
jgi:hypothetical protein